MCTVSQPEKVVSAMESFISYGVKTLTSRASFPGPEFFVRRRFSDFEWLFEALSRAYPASIIPPLPDKHAIKGVLDRFETEFVKTRMAALEQFLARVSADNILSQAPCYKSFLTLKQYDFNAIKVDLTVTKSSESTVVLARWQQIVGENRQKPKERRPGPADSRATALGR